MTYELTPQERAILADIRANGTETEARRAAIVLMSASGAQTGAIADAVELSKSQVRHWRRAWREQRLGIFPGQDGGAPSPDAAVTGADASTEAETGQSPPVPGVDAPRLALDLRDSVGMVPTDPMPEAGRKALHYHFERMLQHEPGSRLGHDPEAVHDMRVATRRMRSAFRIMQPYFKKNATRDFRSSLRTTAQRLGAVRDLDVLLEKARRFEDAHPGADLTPLYELWDRQRQVARSELIAYLDSKDFARFVARFDAFLKQPGKGAKPLPDTDETVPHQVRHVVPHLIYQRYERVRAYETALDQAGDGTLHALRIDIKRFRYMVEFFSEVLGPQAARVIDACKTMQDHLGDLNDAAVAIEAMESFVARHDAEFSGIPQFIRPDISGVHDYIDATRAKQRHLRDTFPAAWASFNSEAMRRNLALAIAAL